MPAGTSVSALHVLAALLAGAGAVTFSVPGRVGAAGYAYSPLDPAPIGISYVGHRRVLLELWSLMIDDESR